MSMLSIIFLRLRSRTRHSPTAYSTVTTSCMSPHHFLCLAIHQSSTVSSFRDSTVPNQAAGEFWAVLNRILIIFQIIAIILSEIGWPLAFFNRFFPVLGSEFGLGPVGAMQCLYVYSPVRSLLFFR